MTLTTGSNGSGRAPAIEMFGMVPKQQLLVGHLPKLK